MTKGSYPISENSTSPPRKDTSFRSFICALLIFLLICLIILLATINWNSGKNEENTEKPIKKEDNHQSLARGEKKSTKTEEKINASEATPKLENKSTVSPSTTKMEKSNKDKVQTSSSSRYFDMELTTASTSSDLKETTATNFTDKDSDRDSSENVITSSIMSSTIIQILMSSSTINSNFTTTDSTIFYSGSNSIPKGLTEIDTTSSKEFVESSVVPSTTNKIEGTTKDSVPSITIDSDQNLTTVDSTVLFSSSGVGGSTEIKFSSSSKDIEDTVTDGTASSQMTVEVTLESTSKESTDINNVLSTTLKEEITESPTTKTAEMSTTDRIQTRNVNIQEKEEFVCRSVACNATASIILSQMNHSATPCEDFYEFACGGVHQVWKESAEESNAEMLSMQLSDVNDLSPKYLKDFKNFHDSCLEYEDDFNYRERIHGVEQLLETIGKFQLGTETHPSLDLTELVAKLILRQSMPLFDIGIDVDKQSSNLILQLTLPQKSTLRAGLENWSGLLLHKERCLKIQNSQTNGLYLNITGIYDSYQKCQDDFAYYLNSVENVLLELEVFANLQANQAQLVKEIKDIRFTIEYDVLDSLSLLPRTETFRHFIQKKYDVRKISDLQIQYPVLQWKKLFETLTGHEVETNTLVQVYVGKYFNDMLTSLAKASPLKLNNALLAIHAHDLFINTVLSKEKSNRNLFCFDLSKKLLPDVWAYLVKTVTINEQKYQNVRVTNLFTKLKHNFCNSFQNEAWMDESTKISLISKCRNLSLILFSSVEEATLTKRYQTLNLTGNYQINLIHLLLHYRQTIYSIEGTTISPATVFSYFLDPLSNEPLVVYASNAIAVPVGLMHKASADLPNYVIMARIGFEIARQITRHFDPVGIKYKIHLSPNSKQAYLDFVQSYDDVKSLFSSRILQHKNISFHLTESTSANEMIVDNAAFKLAYDSVESYKSETNDKLLLWLSSTYSREEIFFIAVAQEFCKKTTVLDFMLQVFESRYLPPVLRVENIMGNSEEFTKTFDCAIGSGMNQFEEKLIVKFPYLIKADDENNENDDSFAEDK